ncbi:TVP38/TMEM64 family protein [Planococcus kocurii]|uniref:TVP38/TMEM64 family protein n=1 Tax=Planococcus kocurii TaxID=1374 RepID=UPI000A3E7809|nr:VTT domain-containing protein [Planococcus kocurii]
MEILLTLVKTVILLIANIVVGAVGFIPSALMTAINIQSLGLYGGATLTFAGEIFGALFGFYLYRFGFSKADPKWLIHPFWQKFQRQTTKQVFSLVILLRLLPFMPSGFVTAGAALTTINGKKFWVASTIGKIPAVIMELAVVYGLIQVVPKSVQYLLFGALLTVSVIIWLLTTKQKKAHQSTN